MLSQKPSEQGDEVPSHSPKPAPPHSPKPANFHSDTPLPPHPSNRNQITAPKPVPRRCCASLAYSATEIERQSRRLKWSSTRTPRSAHKMCVVVVDCVSCCSCSRNPISKLVPFFLDIRSAHSTASSSPSSSPSSSSSSSSSSRSSYSSSTSASLYSSLFPLLLPTFPTSPPSPNPPPPPLLLFLIFFFTVTKRLSHAPKKSKSKALLTCRSKSLSREP